MARNYSDTGATNQAGRNLITIDAKTGQFVLPNDTIANSISGYLERINMEFKEPINKIPARWHIDLIISSAIGGEEPGEYNVSMSSHLQNAALPSMLNGIAGALDDPRWSEDRFIRMRVYMKTRPGKDPVLAAAAYMSKADKDFLPAKWPWDDARRAYAAPVPSDLDEAGVFWLGVAHALCLATGGTVVGADKATIKLPYPVALGLPGATPSPTSAPAQDDASKAIAFFNGALDSGMEFHDAVTKTFDALKKKGADVGTREKVAKHCTAVGYATKAIAFGKVDVNGDLDTDGAPSTTQEATDDLPF